MVAVPPTGFMKFNVDETYNNLKMEYVLFREMIEDNLVRAHSSTRGKDKQHGWIYNFSILKCLELGINGAIIELDLVSITFTQGRATIYGKFQQMIQDGEIFY